jgi:RNA polymerase sigma-70 factor (ECF subfamily)
MARWTAATDPPAPTVASRDGLDLVAVAQRAAAGDDIATRQFLKAVWPMITRVIAGVLGPAHPDLDDVVQQALIALLRAIVLYRGECHPAGYASRIALHIALRARKRSGVERARARVMADMLPPDGTVPSASDEAAKERRRQVLNDLLESLPEEQAHSLALRIVLGWSLDEVALATGAPVNTVRSRVRLAKEALRRRIEANTDLAEDLEVEG